MKISQSVAYAIQAALKLAEEPNPTPVSCSQLAASGQMPERFLLQILRELTKQGILSSTRGGGGGFTLGRSPRDVSLLDIVEAVDGPLHAGLPSKGTFPERSAGRLQKTLQEIVEQARHQLAAVKLSDLIAHGPPTRLNPAVGTPLLGSESLGPSPERLTAFDTPGSITS